VLDYARELTEQLNIEHAPSLARQLLILIEGAITLSRVMGDYNAADDARNIAELLLKQASKPE
jgi:hypothetical protein